MKTYKETKESRYITELYEKSSARCLADVYGTYSHAKAEAFKYCQRLMAEHDGFDLRILSSNTYMFTAAFGFWSEDTGEMLLMYITPNKNKIVPWTGVRKEV